MLDLEGRTVKRLQGILKSMEVLGSANSAEQVQQIVNVAEEAKAIALLALSKEIWDLLNKISDRKLALLGMPVAMEQIEDESEEESYYSILDEIDEQ